MLSDNLNTLDTVIYFDSCNCNRSCQALGSLQSGKVSLALQRVLLINMKVQFMARHSSKQNQKTGNYMKAKVNIHRCSCAVFCIRNLQSVYAEMSKLCDLNQLHPYLSKDQHFISIRISWPIRVAFGNACFYKVRHL